MVTKLGFDGGLTCALACGDLVRSIAWYQNVLGFELLYRMDDMGWCEFKSPVDRVNVGLSEVETPLVEGGATLTFGVKDIDAARSALESAEVKFDGETRVIPDMVKLATFFDPDGNKLMLYQDLESASDADK
jgi:predicted enzyme related to lactoylglutathione lyase